MKPLIFIAFTFTFFCANAQGKFVQAAYMTEYQSCHFCGKASNQTFKLYIYNDTSILVEMNIRNYASIRIDSFVHAFKGKGKLSNDTLSIQYISFSQKLNKNKHATNVTYRPGINERFFTPPLIFVIEDNLIKDPNSDFPTLKKVSPAIITGYSSL